MWYKVNYYLNGHPRSRMEYAATANLAVQAVREKFKGATNVVAYPDYNYNK